VDFYDANGHLVDTCTDYLSSNISASATASFKVSCGDPDAPKLVPHVSFKVRLGFTSDEGGP
jgi:hypothetical protein